MWWEMEVYSEVENDAGDAYPYDATAGTAGDEHEEPHHNMQMVRHIEEEEDADRSDLINMGVFKPTSRNATKRLRMRQETRGTTRSSKIAEATLKQIASQEFQAEKGKMQNWKQMIMQEVAQELQSVKKSAEAQKVEMEKLKMQLQDMEVKSDALERELGFLKAKEEEPGRQPGKHAPGVKSQAQPTTQRKSLENPAKAIEEEDGHPVTTLENEDIGTPAPHSSSTKNTPRRNYASVAASKPAQAPEHPWTKVVYKNQKQQATKPNLKMEDQGRRILFPQVAGQQKSGADLMLALNEALQKAGEETRFCRVRYSPSGAISTLLTEKANAGLFIPRLSNVLIRAAKTVDQAIVGVEILEHWQRLKVHGMSLERYLGEGYMELLKREVESSTGIQLKSLPCWHINENRLKEQQETGKRGSAIVITVKREAEAKKLCASGHRFGRVVRVVERYWEAGPSSVCITCCDIGHQQMGGCGDRPQKCVICAGPHKIEAHQCGVAGCKKGMGKIWVHVTSKCANCSGTHEANSPRCISRHQAEVKARKEKKTKGKEKDETQEKSIKNDPSTDTPSPDSEMGMDNEKEKSVPDYKRPNLVAYTKAY